MKLGRVFSSSRERLLKKVTIALRIRRLKRSGIFDPDWYLKRYPDVAESGVDPARHFATHGWHEDRIPGPYADPEKITTIFETVPFANQRSENDVSEKRAVPHYGRLLHQLIDAARSRTNPPNLAEDYDVIRDNFDFAFYLTRYRDLTNVTKLDLVSHYMRAGVREKRDPSPYFSTKRYLARYPSLDQANINPYHHWLSEGRRGGQIALPFAEFDDLCELCGVAPSAAQEALVEKHKDIRQRLEHGTLGEMVAKAAKLDPLVAHTWPEAFQPKIPPFHSPPVVSRLAVLDKLQRAASRKEAQFVVVVNKPRWSGARRMEGYIAHALAERHGADAVLAIASDQGGEMPPGKLPDGVRYVDFASMAKTLKQNERQLVLTEFLRSLRPEAVFNVNSALMWRMLEPYGKALASSMNIFGCLFCNEQTRFGFWTGYPIKNFYRYFDILAGICTDSHYLAENLVTQYRVPPDWHNRVTVLEAPVDPALPTFPNPPTQQGRRPQVFWAGRFDRQKRLDIVYQIAEFMPEIDIRMWGEPVLDNVYARLRRSDNVIFEGVYESFTDLPLDEADLWLYTSEWDGVPSMLLEVAMTGVPIVGSVAGGTGEILREDMSWPVDDIEAVRDYTMAIRNVLAEPAQARLKASVLRETMLAERTPASYAETLDRLMAPEGAK